MKRNYFLFASLTILLFAAVAFSDNWLTDTGQASNSQPKIIIHAFFCFAWVLALVIQTHLIRSGNTASHMAAGRLAMLVAVGVVGTTGFLYAEKYTHWADTAFEPRVNMIFLASYTLCVVSGFLNRSKALRHKHLMFVGTLYMLGPIAARLGGPLNMNPIAVYFLTWIALFLSLYIYDWRVLQRIHPVTWIGSVWVLVVWQIGFST